MTSFQVRELARPKSSFPSMTSAPTGPHPLSNRISYFPPPYKKPSAMSVSAGPALASSRRTTLRRCIYWNPSPLLAACIRLAWLLPPARNERPRFHFSLRFFRIEFATIALLTLACRDIKFIHLLHLLIIFQNSSNAIV